MKINFYLIFITICTSACLQAAELSSKEQEIKRRQISKLAVEMLVQAEHGTLTEEKLQQYLNRGVDINTQERVGFPALVTAVVNNNVPLAQLLIAYGADVNVKDSLDRTPLGWAAGQNNAPLITLLIAHGADQTLLIQDPLLLIQKHVTARDIAKDKTAYDAAVAAGLVERKAYLAVEAGKKAAHDKLVEQANQQLLLAAQKGNLLAMRTLFKAAVPPNANAQDVLGRTSLMLAARRVDLPMVQFLLEQDADVVNLSDSDGYTALMEALTDTTREKHADQIEVMRLLVQHAHNENAQTKKGGITALMLAVLNNNQDAVKLLIDHGADVNLQTTEGVTALMTTAREGNLVIMKMLIAAGAQSSLEDKTGKTVVDYL